MAVATDLRNAAPRALAQSATLRAPVGIVDIGSNSVRLVIYENQLRNAATLQNEKAICGIGRDMVSTGRLHAEGCAEALEAGIASGDVILTVLARRRQPVAPPSITTPDALRLKIEPTADCGRYDSIRKIA